MKYYLQVAEDNTITDAISYEHEGYVLYETEFPLPAGINGGWWKLENGVAVEYPELKPIYGDVRVAELEEVVADMAQVLVDKGVIY